jgi:hypothetical protein
MAAKLHVGTIWAFDGVVQDKAIIYMETDPAPRPFEQDDMMIETISQYLS